MMHDIAGQNGFYWFKGVVEDRQDPLNLGRIRVRIIGVHNESKLLVPTESLPWASIILPTNGSRTLSVPKEGEWVFGFFEDGSNSQKPIILGVVPGIVPPKVATDIGFRDPRTQEEIEAAPKLPNGIVADISGEPSTPPLAREKVENTGVDVANNKRDHVCDIRQYIILDNSTVGVSFTGILKKIRDAIRAALAALGLDPSGVVSYIVSFLKSVAREVKRITTIVKENLEFLTRITDAITKIKAMIAYILSLPAKLLALLRDCLSALTGSITEAIKGLLTVNIEGVSDTDDFTKIVSSVNELVDASKDVISSTSDAVAIPVQIAGTITNAITAPVSSTELESIEQSVKTAIAQYAPSSDSIIKNNTFSSSKLRMA